MSACLFLFNYYGFAPVNPVSVFLSFLLILTLNLGKGQIKQICTRIPLPSVTIAQIWTTAVSLLIALCCCLQSEKNGGNICGSSSWVSCLFSSISKSPLLWTLFMFVSSRWCIFCLQPPLWTQTTGKVFHPHIYDHLVSIIISKQHGFISGINIFSFGLHTRYLCCGKD